MSKKRKRDSVGVDLDLVQIYNQLADENGEIRITAAQQLLSKVYPIDESNTEQVRTIVTRLFRGLCSSRKAARLGFSVALTEALAVIRHAATSRKVDLTNPSYIIDLLLKSTTIDGKPTGQEERDHYIGRLFGAEAIIKSAILFPLDYLEDWKRLVDIICDIALDKSWLRRECGWIFYASITASVKTGLQKEHVLVILDRLSARKLIRTPEGLAIWLGARQTYPDLKFPNQLWKYDHPLAKKDINALGDLMKDARAQSNEENNEYEAQGTARWSPQLHFAWVVVLKTIIAEKNPVPQNGTHSKKSKAQPEIVDFDTLWSVVVDKNFFIASASTERKHVGFLLWTKVLSDLPPSLLSCSFSPHAVHCLTQELKGQDRYLAKAAQKVTNILITRMAELDDDVATLCARTCLDAILSAVNFENFDRLSNSKTIQKLIEVKNLETQIGLQQGFSEAFNKVLQTSPANLKVLKGIVEMQAKVFSAMLLEVKDESNTVPASGHISALYTILQGWITSGYFSQRSEAAIADDMRRFIRQKLASAFEQCLNRGLAGSSLVKRAIADIHKLETSNDNLQLIPQFDKKVKQRIDEGWKKFKSFTKYNKKLEMPVNGQSQSFASTNKDKSVSKSKVTIPNGGPDQVQAGPSNRNGFVDGISLLYALVLFEIYNGETDAVEILEELITRDDLDLDKILKGNSVEAQAGRDVDSLVEVLLSFASKPSRFMRKATIQIFESLVSGITLSGLDPLIRILAAKENAKGQDDMFEQEVEVDSEDDSDLEMLDSDVEVLSQSASNSDIGSSTDETEDEADEETDQSSIDGTAESNEDSTTSDVEDEELAAFDAALIAALGTRKGQDDMQADDTSGSSSDEDMNDDEMMAVDEKLAEVFRARNQQANKKKEQKDAKENVVNFKNRVLDMMEVYLKSQHLNILSVELIMPLLKLARETPTKQLSDKACTILRDYTSRCKGQNVPAVHKAKHDLPKLLDHLKQVHHEVCLESSNNHSRACTQCSLLLVKSFVHGGGEFKKVVDIYGSTRVRQVTDPKCKVQPGFFTEWNNWCVSAKASLSK